MRLRRVLAAAAVAMVLAGCELPGSDGSGGPGEPGGEPATGAAAPCSPGGSLEGCFSRNQMDDYLNEVAPLVIAFFNDSYRNLPEPDGIVYVPTGRVSREACVDANGRQALATEDSYEYCPADGTIYIGQDLLWQFYDRLGDAAPAVGLAHEYTHHAQTRARIPTPRTRAAAIAFENQADCGAGAFMKWADEKGYAEYPDDLQDVAGLLDSIGSAEGPDRDHGTAEERRAAFDLGLRGGLAACNDFFPNTPLIR